MIDTNKQTLIRNEFDNFIFTGGSARDIALALYMVRNMNNKDFDGSWVFRVCESEMPSILEELGYKKKFSKKEILEMFMNVLSIRVVEKVSTRRKVITTEYVIFELSTEDNMSGNLQYRFFLSPEVECFFTEIDKCFIRTIPEEIALMNNINTVNLYLRVQLMEKNFGTTKKNRITSAMMAYDFNLKTKRDIDRAIESIFKATNGRLDIQIEKESTTIYNMNLKKCCCLPKVESKVVDGFISLEGIIF